MASTRLTKTNTGTITNNKKFTISFWMKRSIISAAQETVFGSYPSGTSNDYVYFPSGDQLGFFGSISGSQSVYLLTTRKFRDVAAWYHIVIAVDTTQGTAADRVKIYVNGTQETAFDQSSYPAQDVEFRLAKASNVQEIGCINNGNHFDGLLSHFHFIDGTQYAASDFGSTDSTTGEWKINTAPSVTYGTNGFFVLKDGNSVTDASGNSNNFTVAAGTLTNTEDCPDNVFPVMNPLAPGNSSLTFENGNLHNGDQSPNDWQAIPATMAAFTGKFYWEFKIEGVWGSTSNTTHRHGVANMFATLNNNPGNGDVAWTDDPYAIGWQNSSGIRYGGDSSITMTSEFGTYVANDILMFAMDLTNKKLYFGKNGTWLNSGDPTSGSSGTGAYSMPDLGRGGIWAPYSETKYGSDKVSWNMGNGYFKTTAISSEGTNASGIGKFEYDVPTGYTALSTKGLNE